VADGNHFDRRRNGGATPVDTEIERDRVEGETLDDLDGAL
jgi:hypothetical protein